MLNNVAAFYRDAEDWDAAEPLYRECLAEMRKIHPEDHVEMVPMIYGLGRVMLGQGNLAGAEEHFARIIVLLGDDSPDARLVITRSNQGEVLMKQERYREAEELLLPSFKTLNRLWGDAHPETIRAHNRVISLYERWGRPEDAERYRELGVR